MAIMGMMNTQKKGSAWFTIAWLSILGMNLTACRTTPVPLVNVTPLTSTSTVIYPSMTRNFNGEHGVLNIYIDANDWPNVLTPVSEQEKEERTATLWLVIVKRPETYSSFRVRSGETIAFEGFKIHILRIEKDDRGAYFVEVEVTEP
jgi:hypothetical protein